MNRLTGFVLAIMAIVVGSVALPISASVAQEAPVAASGTPVSLVENADRTASTYARQNPGIAIAVFLGTQSVVTPGQIKTILTREFTQAGVSDPITFFFDQNDTPGAGVAYYFDGDVRGPFNLTDARPQAVKAAKSYQFRKEKGLLSYSTSGR